MCVVVMVSFFGCGVGRGCSRCLWRDGGTTTARDRCGGYVHGAGVSTSEGEPCLLLFSQ